MIRLCLLLLCLAGPAAAHFGLTPEGPPLPTGFDPQSLKVPDGDLGLAQITVTEAGGRFALIARLSAVQGVADPVLPAGCRAIGPGTLTRTAREALVSLDFACDAPRGALLLPWSLEAARLRLHSGDVVTDTVLRAGRDGLALPLAVLWPERLPWHDVGLTYLVSGVKHVLGGLDHLAFVLCLVMMARPRQLPLVVTAFTLGHSVTLILGATGRVALPMAPVEACIALSILFLAREAMLGARVGRREIALTAGFGLIHGLGFASALAEVGLPPQQSWLALGAFNIGVEAGQLIFVAVVLAVGASLPGLRAARAAGLVAVGGAAFFWTLERTAALLS